MKGIGIKISPALDELIKKAASLESRSVSNWIRMTLEREAIKQTNRSKL